ncbi:two-component system sensor histidine kinase QseC [Mesocricetibacter intestinalis]|uniref:Sensor protein QseC n=1 Tax=Mesocricetibacter intestinalis TaxID=1521930 RepID=A0A4R6VLY0_9PAST|nr:two-component system sensor histidine kinase QseC [Mesocricetibacter intestinalis]
MKNSSLRFRLMLILSAVALLIWTVSALFAWSQVSKKTNDTFDLQQILLAKRLASSDLRHLLKDRKKSEERRRFAPPPPKRLDDDALAFAIFSRRGEMILSDDHKGSNFIFAPARGFSVATPSGESAPWRIFWMPSDNGRLMIAVGQKIEYRAEVVREFVFSQLWIWIASLPLLIGLIIFFIGRELRILKNVGEEVKRRSPQEVGLLSTRHIPEEILPLVESLNLFFQRTSDMLLRERRFTSDAAHELRSPLTALRIQTEIAQMAADDEPLRREALQNLQLGIDRAGQLVEQLLTLSRLDHQEQPEHPQRIDWPELIRSLIGELYFSARERNMELAFIHLETPSPQQGQPLLLSLMLRNLVDNGLRYCPPGTRINLYLEKDRIRIEDNGGGVEEEALEKLGQRFFRPAGQNEKGSGLGLSIVKRIAELHHYRVKLENIKAPNGTRVGLRCLILLH